jgi:hypothetical protein
MGLPESSAANTTQTVKMQNFLSIVKGLDVMDAETALYATGAVPLLLAGVAPAPIAVAHSQAEARTSSRPSSKRWPAYIW